MVGGLAGGGHAGGCTAARRDLPAEQVAELAKQRKRDANARHRARKKAMQGLEQAIARVQLDAEQLRGADLAAAEAAMNAMKEYQEEALRVLQFAALTENLDGEVALLDSDFAALDSGRVAALLSAERQRERAQQAQRQASSNSDNSEGADGASGGQPSRTGAEQPAAQRKKHATQQQAAAVAEAASAAASACSGGDAAGSNAASAVAASTVAAAAVEAQPCYSSKSRLGAEAASASASQSAAASDAACPEQRQFVANWLAQLDGIARNWQSTQVPEVRNTFVRMAAVAFNFLSTSVISQRNREFTVQLQHMVQRWEACPGSRREIEDLIAGRISTRQAVIKYLAEHRVPTLMELWATNCCPPPAPGTPSLDGRPAIHHVLLPIAHHLQANLSPSQLKELEAAWGRYKASTAAARQQRTSAAVQLQYAAALQSVSWQKQSTQPSGGCTAERSQAYTAMADSTGCLSSLGHAEMAALVELQEALVRVLTPIQMARVFLTSYPYNPDMTQICSWLFAQPDPAAIQPGSAGTAPAGMTSAAAAAAAARAASSDASQHGAAPTAPLPPSVTAPPPLPPMAVDALESLGLLPDSGADAFMDMLSDGELDFLLADLAGGCRDAGHLLAASPRLP